MFAQSSANQNKVDFHETYKSAVVYKYQAPNLDKLKITHNTVLKWLL